MAPNLSRRGNISNNWSDKILAELPDRPNNSRFWEDGLNTGVRVLRTFLKPEIRILLGIIANTLDLTEDGRLDIKLHQDRSNLAGILHHLHNRKPRPSERRESTASISDKREQFPLHLNIVIHVVGSAGTFNRL